MKCNIDIKSREVAYALRLYIVKAQKTPLPENLTIKDNLKGEVQVPDIVDKFFNNLTCAPGMGRAKSANKVRRVKLITGDAIFAVTPGLKKPSKHLQLGMAIKSLTGIRKVVDLLNRFCHCVSYTTIEELETELTFEVTREKRLTPNGMSLNSANNISVAFDNFDRYVETITGKDTLRDTVGIAYETSSSATGDSVDFQAEDYQEVEISTHVNEESFVVTSDGF